jgi:hypothetical protein
MCRYSGRRRATPFDSGLVGEMLQTGDLIRDLSPRELVTMPCSTAMGARDIEVTGAGLEEAFLELTGDPDAEAQISEPVPASR